MGFKRNAYTLAEFCLAWTLMLAAIATGAGWAQAHGQSAPAIATTHVADTIYKADGTPASGTVLISWPAFSTWAGNAVPAGSTSVTLGSGGSLNVQLVANGNSNPMGSYYTVVYHLDDGSVTREYWVVPVTSATVAVSGIRSTVLPASVALQTVSKAYVDTAIAAAVTGHPLDSSPYVVKSGDTMTGPLVLPSDPVAPLQAADKGYVDAQVTGLSSGLSQKVSLFPSATQTVAQPPGTELAVNTLNAVQSASQYVSGAGNNGIANVTASAACTSGCEVNVKPSYPSAEATAPTTWPNKTHVDDHRGGATFESFFNPIPAQNPGNNAAKTIEVVSTQSAQSVLAATGNSQIFSTGLQIDNRALAGGSNAFPAIIQGTVPYFKTTFTGLSMNGTNNTIGQHVLFTEQQDCYAVGDCLMGGMFMRASGGFRDDADEGSHPFDRQFLEDNRVFTGSCAQGCSTGSTVVQISGIANPGTQGEGRYLIDTAPAKSITSGTIIGGSPSGGRQPSATFAGTSFPVSTFLETAQTIPTQSNSISPGTVSVAIATSSVPSGFATNTAALAASSGVACLSDVAVGDARPLNFETAAYTIVDGSHLSLTLNRAHATGATIAVGGLCGYGLEQKVDTLNGIRQVFPVIGSTSPTTLLYAGGYTSIVGVQGLTSAYTNANLVVASIARNANVVTVTTTSNFAVDLNALTLTVQGVTDPSYNGSFVVTTTGINTLTYANPGPNSTSSGGSLSIVTGAFGLYPMAEVLAVYNPTTKAVDGQMTLAANTVSWATGDPVEQPHYFQEWVSADTDVISQFTPRASRFQSAGIQYDGNNGPGLRGFQIDNGSPASSYFGNGGTHAPPSIGINILGVWRHAMEMQAGEDAAIEVYCNSHGCDKWNSGYDLFQMQTSAGLDHINYSPATSTLQFALRGTGYTFTPQSLTANTINVNTLNAGTITGAFSGQAATVGTIAGLAVAGSGISITGAGTASSPFSIAATGTSGGGAGAGYVPIATPTGTFRCNGFGDSVMAGDFNVPSTLNYFDVWATAFLPNCTHNNQAVSGWSVQDIATRVYNTTFSLTDYTLIGTASNDSFPAFPLTNQTSNYFDGLGAIVTYAAIPDGPGPGGYAAKIKGSAVAHTGSGWGATDQYPIGLKTTHATDTATWSFVGDVFYMGTSSADTGGQIFSLAFDGGVTQTYGPFGAGGTGAPPWVISYDAHGGTVTYSPFLIRVPLAPGRNVQHTVVFTCNRAPCYVDYMAANGAANGPKVLTPLFWQAGNHGSRTADASVSAAQNQMNRFLVDELSDDGLAVAAADLSGYLNYYANPANWANVLHPNNAGSAAQAQGLGARSQQGIVPANNPKKLYEYSFYANNYNGYAGSSPIGQLNIMDPIKIESVSINVAGGMHGCTGGASTPPAVQLFNEATGESYLYPFSALGQNQLVNLFNNRISGFGARLEFTLTAATCTGTPVGGNENINVAITYSRL